MGAIRERLVHSDNPILERLVHSDNPCAVAVNQVLWKKHCFRTVGVGAHFRVGAVFGVGAYFWVGGNSRFAKTLGCVPSARSRRTGGLF